MNQHIEIPADGFLFINREVMRLISAYGLSWTVA